MKTTKVFECEIMRHGITPAAFLSYVRRSVDKKGGYFFRSDLDIDYFKISTTGGNGVFCDYSDGTPETRGCSAERCIDRPYEKQTYIKNFDGSVYNEIVEFTFDDDKTGTGYYYILSTETAPEDTESNKAELLESTAKRAEKKIADFTAKIATIETDIKANGKWFTKYHLHAMQYRIRELREEIEKAAEIVREIRGTGEAEPAAGADNEPSPCMVWLCGGDVERAREIVAANNRPFSV